jgi:hypothetical protein
MINKGGFERKIKRLKYAVKEKFLVVTNVNDRKKVEEAIANNKNIDNVYFTDDYSEEVLSNLDITKESFDGSYWYSIGPLVALYKSKGDYTIYQTGDCTIEDKDFNWIDPAIEILKENESVKVASPTPSHAYKNMRDEEVYYNNYHKASFLKNSEWSYTMGFSDQTFMVPTQYFQKPIYNETNELSEKFYAKYNGFPIFNIFEKRVCAHLLNNKLYRITSNNISYQHPSYLY